MFKSSELQKKWEKVLDHKDLPNIKDAYRRSVLTVLLENQQLDNQKTENGGYAMMNEAVPANTAGNAGGNFPSNPNLKGYDPVLISLVRRAMPNLMAFDVCGVQPMQGPTGLIFALKSKYTSQAGAEALHFEADTDFSGTGTHSDPLDPTGAVTSGTGLDTFAGEKLGTGGAEPEFPEMALSIDKVTVTAKTRALKAEYTMEIAQDLKAIHGLDAESELANILSAEILGEINREVIRTIYRTAEVGAQHNVAAAGTFDLDTDANGRWMVEKFKGLMFQLERDANQIAKRTRRGRANFVICSSDVASALSSAGLLDNAGKLSDNLNVDDTGNTFVGVLNGRYKVYVDPYALNNVNFAVLGYKGANAYDAGLFYCPYVPLQMVRAVDQQSFQPKIGFKTRYGLVANPFSNLAGTSDGTLVSNTNVYYRKFAITNLL